MDCSSDKSLAEFVLTITIDAIVLVHRSNASTRPALWHRKLQHVEPGTERLQWRWIWDWDHLCHLGFC